MASLYLTQGSTQACLMAKTDAVRSAGAKPVCTLSGFIGASIRQPRLQFQSDFSGVSVNLQPNVRLANVMPAAVTNVRAAVDTVVTEPITGVQLASSTTPAGASKELVLLGCGVREKKIAILNVKVYALGLYVDPAVSASLAAFKGKDLAKDAAFFKALAEAPVDKSVHIVLARDVEGKQFWEALDEALAPRLKAAGAGPDGDRALATFGEAFKSRSLKKNTGIYLTWAHPATLQIGITEDATTLTPPAGSVATIESAPLLSALFDVYLGPEPVSPTAKTSIAAGAAKLL